MKKIALAAAAAAFCLAQSAIAAPADQTARAGFNPGTNSPIPNPAPRAVVVDEGFDDITTLVGAGWTLQNSSDGPGSTDWFQGNDTVFAAFDGITTAYIGANFNNTDGSGTATISNWLVSPPITFGTGSTFSFYTNTVAGSSFPDRLQVRICPSGACADFGTGPEGTGDFSVLALDINAAEAVGGYPETWTQFTVTSAEGVPSSGTGRIALRYFVHDAGPVGNNSNYIGIDRVVIDNGTPGGPAPTARELPSLGTWAMLGLAGLLAMFGFAGLRRRQSI